MVPVQDPLVLSANLNNMKTKTNIIETNTYGWKIHVRNEIVTRRNFVIRTHLSNPFLSKACANLKKKNLHELGLLITRQIPEVICRLS